MSAALLSLGKKYLSRGGIISNTGEHMQNLPMINCITLFTPSKPLSSSVTSSWPRHRNWRVVAGKMHKRTLDLPFK